MLLGRRVFFFLYSDIVVLELEFCNLIKLILQVFGEKVFDKYGKGFISMHFSDQHPATHRKMLQFKFALPDANNMGEMTRLIALVPYYIDLIGRYKLSSQVGSVLWNSYLLIRVQLLIWSYNLGG